MGDWTDVESWRLVPEVIFPVGHPDYIVKGGGMQGLRDPTQARLLHFREKHRVRFGWRDWLTATKTPFTEAPHPVVFSDALGSIGAAGLGHGIALGWSHLVLDAIQQGTLQQIGDIRFATGNSVYLVASKRKELSTAARVFVEWVLKQMATDMQSRPEIFQAAGSPANS